MTRFVIVGDSHGDQIDPEVEATLRGFVRSWKPTIRVHLGDAFDLRAIRSSASESERNEGMRQDIEEGKRFLDWFKPTAFLLGNHEARLDRLIHGTSAFRAEHASALKADMLSVLPSGCQVMPYDVRSGVLRLGGLVVVHGFGAGGASSLRTHTLTYGDVVMGHVHTSEELALPGDGGAKVGRSIGCLCRLDMPYLAGSISSLRHAHGWAYGTLDGERATINRAVRYASGWNI